MAGLRIEHDYLASTVAPPAVLLVEHCLAGLLCTDVVHIDKALNDERVKNSVQKSDKIAGPIRTDS